MNIHFYLRLLLVLPFIYGCGTTESTQEKMMRMAKTRGR